MCRHPYAAQWAHNISNCPLLWHPDVEDANPVYVRYKEHQQRHEHLPGFYNDFYHQYLEADFPRVIVRYEDLLFFGKNVTETLCECGGGVPREDEFVFPLDSSKAGFQGHGSERTNLYDALVRYGNDEGRTKSLTDRDLEYSKKWFDPALLKMFNYRHPET